MQDSDVCKASYHMGAILDVSEKACEAIKEVSKCAHHGECDKWSELTNFKAAFNTANVESAWKARCQPLPQPTYQNVLRFPSTQNTDFVTRLSWGEGLLLPSL